MQELTDIEFYESLDSQDDLGMVIRSHIHLEHWVDKFNAEALHNYEAFAKDLNPEYHAKVLISCMAGLHMDLKKPLLAFGKVRNGFAHRPNYVLTASEANNIYEALSSRYKDQLQVAYKQLALTRNRKEKTFQSLSPNLKIQCMAMFLRDKLKKAHSQASLNKPIQPTR